MPSKLAEVIQCNKIHVDIIGPYKICRKGRDPLILKAVIMIDPISRWFDITQYNDKKSMTIANLVETMCLVRYPWPVESSMTEDGNYLVRSLKVF